MSQERERFRLIAEGRSGDGSESLTNDHQGLNFQPCNFVNMVQFLPNFNEKDPDVIFSLFENFAKDRAWNDAEHISVAECFDGQGSKLPYQNLNGEIMRLKEAVLKAYELVPKAYRW